MLYCLVIQIHFKMKALRTEISLYVKCNKTIINESIAISDYISIESVFWFQTESVEFQKIMRFLELLPQYGNEKTFPTLVSILEEHYYWLGEELKAELLAEKELLIIEDYIENLAKQLVTEQFGQTVRLSSEDKSALKNLVAKRIQYAKEVLTG